MSLRARVRTVAAAAAACLAATAAPAAAQGVVPVEQQAKALILEAKDLYRAGAADAALAALARAPEIPIAPEHPLVLMAEATAKAIEEIREDFHAGINYYNRGAVSKALESWDSVLALDAKLVGDKPSRYAQAVAGYWSRELAFKAEDSFRKGEYEDAYALWTRLGKAEPGSATAERGFEKLQAAADTLYKDGYALQEINIDEAKNRWRRVLAILPPQHPLYQKTKKKLLEIP